MQKIKLLKIINIVIGILKKILHLWNKSEMLKKEHSDLKKELIEINI